MSRMFVGGRTIAARATSDQPEYGSTEVADGTQRLIHVYEVDRANT